LPLMLSWISCRVSSVSSCGSLMTALNIIIQFELHNLFRLR
jgi:hypothetical protein